MRRQAVYLLLALSLGLNAGLLYRWAAGPPGPPPGGGDLGPGGLERILAAHLDRMSEGLGLSDEQRAAIGAVLDERVPQVLEQNRRVVEARRALALVYQAPRWDADAFRASVTALHDAQTELDRLVGEAMIGEASVLSAEQRSRYVRASPWSVLIGVSEPRPRPKR